MRRVGRAMNGDQWRADGACDMHGAAVSRNEQVSALQEGGQLRQAGFSGEVDGLLRHVLGDALDQRPVARLRRSVRPGRLLAYEPVEQSGPVGNGPALGLPVVRADMAGDQRGNDWGGERLPVSMPACCSSAATSACAWGVTVRCGVRSSSDGDAPAARARRRQ